MKLDSVTKAMIASEIRDAVKSALEGQAEVWLTGDQLSAQFGMFTKSWLKSYGHSLPRTQAVVTAENGEEHKTGWCYPMHKIQRMVQTGEIKKLKY